MVTLYVSRILTPSKRSFDLVSFELRVTKHVFSLIWIALTDEGSMYTSRLSRTSSCSSLEKPHD